MDVGASLCMSEIPLTIDEAALLAMLLLVKSQLLPFDAGKRMLVGAETGDIRNDAGIFEFDKCIVDDEAGEVVGVEDPEVRVGGGHRGEGWLGEYAGVEGFEVLNLIFATGAKVVGVLTNFQVADILSYLWSLLLVGEDEGIVVAAAGVILHPSLSWVVGVLVLLVTIVGDGDVGGG